MLHEEYSEMGTVHRSWVVCWLLWGIGPLALGLGVFGIFLPLVPTTPFVLLATGCYMRSSPRMHHWLVSSPMLGPVITTWQAKRGLTLRTKVTTLVLVWLMLGSAALWLVENQIMQYGLVILALVKTIVLARLRTVQST